MSPVEEEGLLSRWSRRKLQTPEETAKEDKQLEVVENLDLKDESETDEEIEQPVLTDADMPSIDSLNEDSDFSMFMSSGVSDKLRNMALRKMFHVPAFNIRDGLDEYDEDFTTFEALGDIVTCDMKHQIEMKEKKKAEQEAEEAARVEAEAMDMEADPGTIKDDQIVDEVDDADYAVGNDEANIEGGEIIESESEKT